MPQPEPTTHPHAPTRARAVVALVVAAVLLAAVAACTGDDAAGPAPEAPPDSVLDVASLGEVPVVTLPDGFVLPDTRGAPLLVVEGRQPALPPPPVYGGSARLAGTITGPDGPVEGATVRLERIVGGRVGAATVTTGAGGRYGATGLHGGAYRVRAWQAPSLATTQAGVSFLPAENGSATVDVDLQRFDGIQLQAQLDSADWRVGGKANLRALLTRQTVNDEGIVIGEGLAASQLRLEVPGGVSVEGDRLRTTNASGIATWPLTCEREGAHAVTVTAQEATVRTTLPSCGPKATTTTTTPGPPDVGEFPVGDEFTVPRPAALPAGTYRTFLTGCATTYQVWRDGAWQEERATATGDTISLSGPARDFRPAEGTDGCRYRRVS